MSEFLWCNECYGDPRIPDSSPCLDCGGGFYWDDDGVEPECPCCGSYEVQP